MRRQRKIKKNPYIWEGPLPYNEKSMEEALMEILLSDGGKFLSALFI